MDKKTQENAESGSEVIYNIFRDVEAERQNAITRRVQTRLNSGLRNDQYERYDGEVKALEKVINIIRGYINGEQNRTSD